MMKSFWLVAICLCFSFSAQLSRAQPTLLGSVNSVAVECELKTVKLYGAGGIAGLDSYQSGFFFSRDGHILTVWSTVLDVDKIIAVCSDGSRYEAEVLGIDPNLEIAVLQTDQKPASFFQLNEATSAEVGERCLAFSNLFGIATGTEMSSLQHGVIMAITELKARRGSIESFYQGQAYIIDAMTNNPGAAGGALTNIRGELLGILGKELKDSGANTWINYAMPVGELKDSIQRILEGKSILRNKDRRPLADRPMQLANLGIVLVPDVLSKTPAYVDLVQRDSPAAKAGLQADDLILFVNSTRITSQKTLVEELKYIDRTEGLALLVQRGAKLQEVIVSR
ncbi:MAG: trypsin-like peptidase domain-containing protein [Planctomycetota bacterium]